MRRKMKYSGYFAKIKFIIPYLTTVVFLVPFFLALSTVFVIDHSLANGVISGKYFWFYGSVGLVAVATTVSGFGFQVSGFLVSKFQVSSFRVSGFRFQSFWFRFSITDGFVLLFVGSVFLSSLALNDTSGNTTKLTILALLLVLYFCLRTILSLNTNLSAVDCFGLRPRNDEPETRNPKLETINLKPETIICFFIILTGLIEACWGLLQLYGFKLSQHGLFKLTGSFFNPGPYAGYLAVVFPLALHFALKKVNIQHRDTEDTKIHRVFSLVTRHSLPVTGTIACIAILLVLPAAMSRAAWLAAIAGSMVALWNKFRVSGFGFRPKIVNYQLSTINSKLSLAVIIVVAAALLTGAYFMKKDSADGRLLTWKVSLSAVAKHPFGVGLDNFPSAYGDAQAAYFASGNASETEEYVAGNPEYGFNEFLQIAIESGIISLLLFIGLIVCAAKGLIDKKEWGILGSLVALLVFACFSYPFSILPFPVVFVFLLAMSNESCFGFQVSGSGFKPPRKPLTVNCQLSIVNSLFLFAMFLLTSFCLWKQYPVYEAYKKWKSNQVLYQVGMYKEAAQNYEPLFPYLNDQIKFLFEYGRSLSQWGIINDSQGIAGQARNDRQVQGMTDQARNDRLIKSNKVLQRAARISCDPMIYNVMGKNYQAMKEYKEAEACFVKSTHIVPNRIYPWYLLMKLYIETGEADKALETAGIVLTKEPKVQSTAVREMREEAGKQIN